MKKLILCLAFAISGCASSAYESGWNSKTTYDVFHECAQTSFSPGFYFPENADRLVTMKLLSREEAEKAKRHQVSVGDRECVAYAAYGFLPAKYEFSSNTKKQLVSRKVTYACDKSPVECPGKIITIADGRVTGIETIEQ
ncbi:hypothetical protein N7922_13985 [Kosakonia sp. ML.JS2a]|uniref:hypothetical protein n=1 Tax=Kosakonia sp. ML.JS2a TaxID=2980557 RepID=UPI0021DB6E26|nr:hypothetical protein [Kosakonia sp. ML.JS2a]UXY09002.1 hypothetical protein N7922_13985 [Kosakonia sp. ML.JS2a]